MKTNSVIQKHIILIVVLAFLTLTAVQIYAQQSGVFDTFRTSETIEDDMANGWGYYWNG